MKGKHSKQRRLTHIVLSAHPCSLARSLVQRRSVTELRILEEPLHCQHCLASGADPREQWPNAYVCFDCVGGGGADHFICAPCANECAREYLCKTDGLGNISGIRCGQCRDSGGGALLRHTDGEKLHVFRVQYLDTPLKKKRKRAETPVEDAAVLKRRAL